MIVKFSHKDWTSAEEGAVVSTTFYGVRKVWFDPNDGLISLLLQSGWVYEHELESEWEYAVLPEEGEDVVSAVEVDGSPRGYFRS